jgi:hypothetical protein
MDIKYKVTDRDTRSGADAFAVTMQGAVTGGGALSGQGYYDPAGHIVRGLHYELKSPDGQQSEIVDVNLAPKS